MYDSTPPEEYIEQERLDKLGPKYGDEYDIYQEDDDEDTDRDDNSEGSSL
jgi:hypothetical protein